MSTDAVWEQDAKRAGQLDRNHKVYVALLIARCVIPGTGRGRKDVGANSPKVSLRKFASTAGMDHKTASAYLRTYDAMAKDDVVPARAGLVPGVDVELPDRATWTRFYRLANPPQAPEASDQDTEATVAALKVPEVETRTPDVAAKVGELVLALSTVKPQKTCEAKYDHVRALAAELASLVGAPVAEARGLQATG